MRALWCAIACWLIVCLLGTNCPGLYGQTNEPMQMVSGNAVVPSAPGRSESITYRRVYVQADPATVVPRGYVPVKLPLLDQLLSATEGAGGLVRVPWTLTHSHYVAVLDGDTLRDGIAFWRVAAVTGMTGSDQPFVIPLGNCGLAIESGYWLDTQQPVELVCDAAGRVYLRASRGGDLVMFWSLRAQDQLAGRPRFLISVPTVPICTMTFLAPADVQWHIEHADSLDTGLARADSTVVGDRAAEVPGWLPEPLRPPYQLALEKGMVAHTYLAMGPSALRWTPMATSGSSATSAWLRQIERVTLMLGQVEVQEELHLDCWGPLDEVLLAIPEPLHLIEARYGDQPLEWSVTEVAGGLTTCRVAFPTTQRGPGHVVRMTFRGDTVYYRPWQLPLPRLLNVRWTEGRVEMAISDTVEVQRLEYRHAAMVRRAGLPSGVEQWEFFAYRPDATWELTLQPRVPRATVEIAGQLTADRDAVIGRIVADVRAVAGESYRIRCRVAKPWTVEQVELDPSTMLDTASGSWRFEGGLLDIPLQEPLTPERPLRLTITTRAPTPLRRVGLTGSALRVVEFLEMPLAEAVFAVRALPPLRVVLTQDATAERLNAKNLAEKWNKLFADRSDAILLRLTQATTPTVQFVEEPPEFVADTQVSVVVHAGSIEEQYRVRCTPQSAPVSHLRLRLTPRRAEPLSWKLEGSDTLLVSRQMVEPSIGTDEAEEWEIEVPELQAKPFVLYASRQLPLQPEFTVALASVADAVSETGKVVIRSTIPVEVHGDRVEYLPIPRQLPQPTDVSTVVRYQPGQHSRVVVRPTVPAPTSAWIAQATVVSRCFPTGVFVHQADFLVRRESGSTIRIEFPTATRIEEGWVNGQRVVVPRSPSPVDVVLPPDRQWSWVRLRFSTQESPMRAWACVQAPPMDVSVPLLEKTWMVLLPEDYQLIVAPPLRAPSNSQRSVVESVFGDWMRWRSDTLQPSAYANGDDDVDRVLAWLGTVATSVQTWNEFATTCASVRPTSNDADRSEVWGFLIDRSALHWLQQRSFPKLEQLVVEPTERGKRFLYESGLVVLMWRQKVILTTAAGLRKYGDICDRGVPVARVKVNSWLANDLDVNRTGAWGILPIDVLQYDVSAAVELPTPLGQDDGMELGWTGLLVEWPEGKPPGSLWLIKRDAVSGLGCGLFLATLATILTVGRRSIRLLPILLGSLAATAVLVRPPWLHLVQYVFVAVGVGWVALGFMPNTLSRNGSAAGVVGTAVGWLMAILPGGWMWAQEGSAPPPTAAPSTFDVLIPIGSDGAVTGEYAFVPRPFYEHLFGLTSRYALAPAWLPSAQHTIQGATPSGSSSRQILELVSRLRVWTTSDEQLIELPYQRSAGQLVQLWLDREPTDIRWNAEGNRAQIVIPRAGEHVLELKWAFRWPPETDPWQFSIPPSAVTELICDAAELADWELTGSIGRVISESETRWRANLPVSDRIVFRRKPATANDAASTCRQFLWMRLQPGSVLVDAVWLFDDVVRAGPALLVAVDPRLRLLNHPAGEQGSSAQQVHEDGRPVVALPLAQNGAAARLTASFLIGDTTGLGQIPVPHVTPLNVTARSVYLAVSGAESVVVSRLPDAIQDAERIVECQQAFGTDKEQPQWILDLSGLTHAVYGSQWPTLAVSLADVKCEVHQHTEITVSAQTLDVAWQGFIRSSGRPVWMHEVQLPAGLEVRHVTVEQGGRQLPVRYALSNQSVLTIWSDVPLTDSYSLGVHGRITFTTDAVPLPTFQVFDGNVADATLRIVRQPDVAAVFLENAPQWQSQEVPASEPEGLVFARVVGAWRLTGELTTALNSHLRVVANQCDAIGYLVTRLRRDESDWWGELDYVVRVHQGVIDVLRLALPVDWDTTFEVLPAQPFTVVDLPQENRRLLLIRPAAPITDQYQVMVRGKLPVTADRVRRVPDVLPLDVQRTQRFVLLPTYLDSQLLEWTTSGLQERALPPFMRWANTAGAWQSYAVIGPRFHASLRRVERVPEPPHVMLADIHIAWHDDGRYSGAAAFDVDPNGHEVCPITVPPQVAVVRAYVDNVPVVPQPSNNHVWQVKLGPPYLPQRIELVFQGLASRSESLLTLAVPHPQVASVATSIWNIRSSWNTTETIHVPAGADAQRSRICQRRLQMLLDTIQRGWPWATELGAPEAADWLASWTPRVAWAYQQWRAAITTEGEVNATAPDIENVIERQLQTFLRKNKELWSHWERTQTNVDEGLGGFGSAGALGETYVQWDAGLRSAEKQTVFAVPSAVWEVTLGRTRPAILFHRKPLLAVFFVVVGALASLFGPRLGRWWPSSAVGLHVPIALIGLAALLWLKPSIIGIVLLALAIWTAWWGPWAPWRVTVRASR